MLGKRADGLWRQKTEHEGEDEDAGKWEGARRTRGKDRGVISGD